MFEKVLTTSDSSGSGRIVIPKVNIRSQGFHPTSHLNEILLLFLTLLLSSLHAQSIAEANFPPLENQNGIVLNLTDVFGKKYGFRYRFWINNASRMYLIEGTQALQHKFQLEVGDVLVFARHPSKNIYVCGRKGGKNDTRRRTPAKRSSTDTKATNKPSETRPRKRAASTDKGGGASGTIGAVTTPEDAEKNGAATSKPAAKATNSSATAAPAKAKPSTAPKSKRTTQKGSGKRDAGAHDLQGMYSYWNGTSMPERRDGVFRAVPNNSGVEGNKVLSQQGYWTAVVTLGGELYQAFFDSKDAASAALEAAIQSI